MIPILVTAKTSPSTVLVPVIDSCNHDSQTPSSSLAFSPLSGCFELQANRQIQTNEEITISYGQKNNDDLLQYFGFVELKNVYDR